MTVAVLPVVAARKLDIREADLEWKFTCGSGPGGQHKNVTMSAVQLTHRPTGLIVRCQGERSQGRNKEAALTVLRSRLANRQQRAAQADRNADRRGQVGTGMRSDKVRTVSMQGDRVVDHGTGRKMSAKRYLKGFLDELIE